MIDPESDRPGWTVAATERPGAYVVRSSDGRDQSYVDLEDPCYLAFDYVRRLGDIVDHFGSPQDPLRLVHIGGAGLTLPRYVAATRPGSVQIVLEPDEHVTDLVRRDLPLPRRSGIKVRPVGGQEGISALPVGRADLVVLDAYLDGQVPRDLLTLEQGSRVMHALSPQGWYVLNLSGRAPFPDVRRSLAALRASFAHVVLSAEPATLRGRREGNLVVMASGVPLPLAALRRRATTSVAPYRILDERQTRDTLGGGSAWTDADLI